MFKNISLFLYSQSRHPSMYCRGSLFTGAVLGMASIELPDGSGKDY